MRAALGEDMLTLTGATRLGGSTVFRDVVVEGERSRATSTVHVLAQTPRLAQHADGWPALWLVRHRGAPGARERIGAVLTLTLDLSPTPTELEALRAMLGPGVEPQPLQPVAGTVVLSVGGSSGPDDMVRAISGPRSASLTGYHRASFVVDLTADGAAMLDAALARELPVLHVAYALTFHHVVDGVLIRAWADLEAAAVVLTERAQALAPDAAVVVATLRERMLMGLTVEVLEGAVDDEALAQLQAIAQQLLDAAVVEQLLVPAGPAGAASVRSPATKRLDLRIRQGMVLSASTTITGLVALDIPAQAGRIRHVDTDVRTHLDVTVCCTVAFDDSPIDAVLFTWELPSTGATDVLRFSAGTSEASFRTLRGPHDGWRYRVEVWLDGRTEPLVLPWVETEETLVVLDLDGVGYVDLTLRLETLALGELRAAAVELEHPALPTADTAVLDAEHPAFRWIRAVAEHPARPWRARVDWLGRDGERRIGAWQEDTGRTLVLVPPEAPTPDSEVLLVFVGPFDDLALVICELRVVGDERSTTLELDGSGRAQQWRRPFDAAWEHRQTRVRPDGRRETDPWTLGDDPILVVRDPFAALVTVVPHALWPTGPWRLAQVQLRPAGADTAGTLLSFRPGDAERTWRLRTAVPGELAYEHRLIMIGPTGPSLQGEWVRSASTVLVLRHPAA